MHLYRLWGIGYNGDYRSRLAVFENDEAARREADAWRNGYDLKETSVEPVLTINGYRIIVGEQVGY